jgi:hypothetical protein
MDVFACQHCSAAPELVVDGRAQLSIVRHALGCPTLLAQVRARWPDEPTQPPGQAGAGSTRSGNPHNCAGRPECVLVSDLPKVTVRTPTLENSKVAAGRRIGRKLPGRNAGVYCFDTGLQWVHVQSYEK